MIWESRSRPGLSILITDPRRPHVYGCCGRVEDLVQRPLLDDLTRVHDEDAVGDLRDHAEVVRNQDHGQAAFPVQLSAGGAGSAPGS